MKHIFLSFIILIITHHLNAQNCDDISGHWVNQGGSLLSIDSVDVTGMIFGSYASSTAVDGQIFRLTGWYNNAVEDIDPTLGFTVNWDTFGSVTSWTGYCKESEVGPVIVTMWHYVNSNTSFEWQRVVANKSVFKPEGH